MQQKYTSPHLKSKTIYIYLVEPAIMYVLIILRQEKGELLASS